MPVETWEALDAVTDEAVWKRFETQFLFRPGEAPGIREPAPSVTYSLTTLLHSEGEHFLSYALDVSSKLLGAFSRCLAPEQRLYALDWNHQCYWFSPRDFVDFAQPTSWLIPLFPYGDYSIFVSEDFSLGTFGHPWQETMCVFGEPLVQYVQSDTPDSFRELRRKPSS